MRCRDAARLAALCLALSLVGCAATTGPRWSAPADVPERRVAADVAVEQDATGFTIVQPVVDADGVRADYESAVAMIADGRYEPAIERLRAVTERSPDATAAHLALGVAYARIDDLERAETSLLGALERNPRHPAALTELGLVQRRQGKFAASRASYEAAIANFADFHHAHRNLAILCDLYLGDAECALRHYEAYRRIVPEDPEVEKWIVDLENRVALKETP